MQVKFSVRGIEKLQTYLRSLPRGVVKVGLAAIAEWIIGTPQRGLQRYQPYKYVPRARAYGQTFKSDKQRRFVMAAIREGRIDPGVPHRTGNTQRGWYAKVGNGGYRMVIGNDTPGAYFTRHDTGQARLNALAGWRKTMDIVQTNIAGALRHANAAINAFLKSGK
jgi:hypothetical protein